MFCKGNASGVLHARDSTAAQAAPNRRRPDPRPNVRSAGGRGLLGNWLSDQANVFWFSLRNPPSELSINFY